MRTGAVESIRKEREEKRGKKWCRRSQGAGLRRGEVACPCEGDITLAVRNKNYAHGPVMLHIVMKPGSVIPAHLHEGVSEALYVVEGEFINEGKKHLPGTSLHVRAGKPHGPHSTEKGCTLLLLWTDKAATQEANLNDFVIAKAA